MIYIILDETGKWDDPTEPVIKYAGTDRDKAVEYFEKRFSPYNGFPTGKYNYRAVLKEIPDGYTRDDSRYTIIAEADNCSAYLDEILNNKKADDNDSTRN